MKLTKLYLHLTKSSSVHERDIEFGRQGRINLLKYISEALDNAVSNEYNKQVR